MDQMEDEVDLLELDSGNIEMDQMEDEVEMDDELDQVGYDFEDDSISEEVEASPAMMMSPSLAKESQSTMVSMPTPMPQMETETLQGLGTSLLLDVTQDLIVEIGRTRLKGSEISELTYGSVIELNKIVGDPVDLFLDGKVVAHGEVVAINSEKLGVRIISIHQDV